MIQRGACVWWGGVESSRKPAARLCSSKRPCRQEIKKSGSHLFPPKLVTIVERKRAKAKRRKRACDVAARELGKYSSEHGGRFVVFGSYATDSMRFDGDFDILVDFPSDGTLDAWAFAEDVCERHAIPLDFHDARMTTSAFIDRVLRSGLVLS